MTIDLAITGQSYYTLTNSFNYNYFIRTLKVIFNVSLIITVYVYTYKLHFVIWPSAEI